MKSALTRIIVSGTFALLVTFTFAAAPKAHAKPAGYTSEGQPFYYAYPNEGYSEPTQPYMMPPEGSFFSTYADQNAYDQSNVGYYEAPWGWGYAWPFGWNGFGGFDGFNFDTMRHHHFGRFGNHLNQGFAHNRRFNRSFTGHSAAIPHAGGARVAGAHVGFHGGARGGGHR